MVPGEIHYVDLPSGRRPAVVVSREELNRGHYVVAVLCTTARYTARCNLPNCVPFTAGEFGLSQNCVAQCELVGFIDKGAFDPEVIGLVDAARLRDIIRAIGYVFDAICEPV